MRILCWFNSGYERSMFMFSSWEWRVAVVGRLALPNVAMQPRAGILAGLACRKPLAYYRITVVDHVWNL
jgi:hypothetical protein